MQKEVKVSEWLFVSVLSKARGDRGRASVSFFLHDSWRPARWQQSGSVV